MKTEMPLTGTTGKLVAGGCHQSAAIGGGGTSDTACTSNIKITGGEIIASGGSYGAGIGGGAYGAGTNIRIEGNADVTAFAGRWCCHWIRLSIVIRQ